MATSLLAFVIVYFFVFGTGTFYLLRLMASAPEEGNPADDAGPSRTVGTQAATKAITGKGSAAHV